MNMNTYYVSFGQSHPLRDHYMVVTASSYANAREAIIVALGMKWAFIYENAKAVIDMCVNGPVGYVIQGE
jgi:hypothetical protein